MFMFTVTKPGLRQAGALALCAVCLCGTVAAAVHFTGDAVTASAALVTDDCDFQFFDITKFTAQLIHNIDHTAISVRRRNKLDIDIAFVNRHARTA